MFWSWVQDKMDERDIPSIRELEKMAGVSNGTISVRKNQLKLPTVVIAEGLCQALHVTWVELWAQAGYIPPGILDTHVAPEEQELISHYRNLSPERQEAAQDVMRGMAQNTTRHYTFMPVAENRLTGAVIQEILSLYRQNQKSEAVLKLLGHTSTEQQEGMQEFLIQLRHDIERWLHQLKAEKAECEIEVGGRAT